MRRRSFLVVHEAIMVVHRKTHLKFIFTRAAIFLKTACINFRLSLVRCFDTGMNLNDF